MTLWLIVLILWLIGGLFVSIGLRWLADQGDPHA